MHCSPFFLASGVWQALLVKISKLCAWHGAWGRGEVVGRPFRITVSSAYYCGATGVNVLSCARTGGGLRGVFPAGVHCVLDCDLFTNQIIHLSPA